MREPFDLLAFIRDTPAFKNPFLRRLQRKLKEGGYLSRLDLTLLMLNPDETRVGQSVLPIQFPHSLFTGLYEMSKDIARSDGQFDFISADTEKRITHPLLLTDSDRTHYLYSLLKKRELLFLSRSYTQGDLLLEPIFLLPSALFPSLGLTLQPKSCLINSNALHQVVPSPDIISAKIYSKMGFGYVSIASSALDISYDAGFWAAVHTRRQLHPDGTIRFTEYRFEDAPSALIEAIKYRLLSDPLKPSLPQERALAIALSQQNDGPVSPLPVDVAVERTQGSVDYSRLITMTAQLGQSIELEQARDSFKQWSGVADKWKQLVIPTTGSKKLQDEQDQFIFYLELRQLPTPLFDIYNGYFMDASSAPEPISEKAEAIVASIQQKITRLESLAIKSPAKHPGAKSHYFLSRQTFPQFDFLHTLPCSLQPAVWQYLSDAFSEKQLKKQVRAWCSRAQKALAYLKKQGFVLESGYANLNSVNDILTYLEKLPLLIQEALLATADHVLGDCSLIDKKIQEYKADPLDLFCLDVEKSRIQFIQANKERLIPTLPALTKHQLAFLNFLLTELNHSAKAIDDPLITLLKDKTIANNQDLWDLCFDLQQLALQVKSATYLLQVIAEYSLHYVNPLSSIVFLKKTWEYENTHEKNGLEKQFELNQLQNAYFNAFLDVEQLAQAPLLSKMCGALNLSIVQLLDAVIQFDRYDVTSPWSDVLWALQDCLASLTFGDASKEENTLALLTWLDPLYEQEIDRQYIRLDKALHTRTDISAQLEEYRLQLAELELQQQAIDRQFVDTPPTCKNDFAVLWSQRDQLNERLHHIISAVDALLCEVLDNPALAHATEPSQITPVVQEDLSSLEGLARQVSLYLPAAALGSTIKSTHIQAACTLRPIETNSVSGAYRQQIEWSEWLCTGVFTAARMEQLDLIADAKSTIFSALYLEEYVDFCVNQTEPAQNTCSATASRLIQIEKQLQALGEPNFHQRQREVLRRCFESGEPQPEVVTTYVSETTQQVQPTPVSGEQRATAVTQLVQVVPGLPKILAQGAHTLSLLNNDVVLSSAIKLAMDYQKNLRKPLFFFKNRWSVKSESINKLITDCTQLHHALQEIQRDIVSINGQIREAADDNLSLLRELYQQRATRQKDAYTLRYERLNNLLVPLENNSVFNSGLFKHRARDLLTNIRNVYSLPMLLANKAPSPQP